MKEALAKRDWARITKEELSGWGRQRFFCHGHSLGGSSMRERERGVRDYR